MFDRLTASVRVERGTPLQTTEGGCFFRTTYDVVLAPVEIARARYALIPTAPLSIKLPPDASGMLSVTFRSAKVGCRLDVTAPGTLRVHLAGQPSVVAALMDTVLLHTARTYVEDSEGRWTRLPTIAVAPVGFGQNDWLVTDAKEPGQPFGLLAEYFAYGERFHFIDIDFASVCAAAWGEPVGEQLTLHWVVKGVPPKSHAAQQATLSAIRATLAYAYAYAYACAAHRRHYGPKAPAGHDAHGESPAAGDGARDRGHLGDQRATLCRS